jgi:small subunit ribosomal protein S6
MNALACTNFFREDTHIVSKKAEATKKNSAIAAVDKAARNYELILILKPNMADDAAEVIVNRTKEIFAKGGEVSMEDWGKCRMAYPIKKCQDGRFYFFKAASKPEVTKEIKSYFAVTEDILRFTLTVLSK